MEFLNFREGHVRVFGKDVLGELAFDKRSIRLQCERELKGKLLLLREAYLDSEGRKRGLGQVASASLTAFLSLFRALLFLRDKRFPATMTSSSQPQRGRSGSMRLHLWKSCGSERAR